MSNNQDNKEEAHWKALGGQEDDFGISDQSEQSGSQRQTIKRTQDLFQDVFGDHINGAADSKSSMLKNKGNALDRKKKILSDFAEFNETDEYSQRKDDGFIQQGLNIKIEESEQPTEEVKNNWYGAGTSALSKITTAVSNGISGKGKEPLAETGFDHESLLEKINHKGLGMWVAESESNIIHGRHIRKGFYYYQAEKVLFPSNENPALISKNKPTSLTSEITSKDLYYTDQSLSYWPSYDKISAKCRGVYLDWLEGDRSDPKTPISYAFIYFSGLEYRIIADKKHVSDAEYLGIYKEVVRLYLVFNENHSFAKYSSGFLRFLKAARTELIDNYEAENAIKDVGLLMRLAPDNELIIVEKINNQEYISEELAWEWLIESRAYKFKTPYDRFTTEFRHLFKVFYYKKYPNGMRLQHNGSSMHLMYEPSNYAVVGIPFALKHLPSLKSYTEELDSLVSIAEDCNLALEPASRWLGRGVHNKHDVETIVLLPKEVIKSLTAEYAELRDVQKWARRELEDKGGLTNTTALWSLLGEDISMLSEEDKEEKKDVERKTLLMFQLIEGLGFGVAPDKEHHGETVGVFESFVMFKGSHPVDFNPSENYHDAKGIIALVSPVLKGTPKNSTELDAVKESKSIMQIVHNAFSLDEVESKSLEAYALWKLSNNSYTIKIKPKKNYFKTFKNPNEEVASLVVQACFHDGLVSKDRVKKAEKVYAYMGWDNGSLSSSIHKLQTSSPELSNRKANAGLDFEKLKKYENETKKVGSILSNVFSNDESVVEAETLAPSAASEEPATTDSLGLDGLDEVHSELYNKLVEKDEWATADVEAMCQSLDLMLSGAIETINDWSFEKIDAAVIEEDDDLVIVDSDSVAELKNI